MKRNKTLYRSFSLGVLALLALVISGCGILTQRDSDDDSAASLREQLAVEEVEGGVTGTFVYGDVTLAFTSKMVKPQVLDIVVEVNRKTLSVQVDFEQGVAKYEGYASDSGKHTQMTHKDREVLGAFARRLDELGQGVALPLAKLRGFASVWSEFPSTLSLRGEVVLEEIENPIRGPGQGEGSYTSICGHLNSFQSVTHNCYRFNRWDDATTYYAYISNHPAGPCPDGTYFWDDKRMEVLRARPQHPHRVCVRQLFRPLRRWVRSRYAVHL